jgi:hypothetical protein
MYTSLQQVLSVHDRVHTNFAKTISLCFFVLRDSETCHKEACVRQE